MDKVKESIKAERAWKFYGRLRKEERRKDLDKLRAEIKERRGKERFK